MGDIKEMQELPSWQQMEEMAGALRTIAANTGSGVDDVLDRSMMELLNGANTTRVFWSWYTRAKQTEESRYNLLVRFGRMLAASCSKTYTVRKYSPAVSSATVLTPLDDLAGKDKPKLYIETDKAETEWIDEDPMCWYIRANALSLADGTMNVLAIEGEDAFDISGELAPVYSFALALYVKEWDDGSYGYKSFRTVPMSGYEKRAEAIAKDGSRRVLTWHPAFPGGLNTKGGLTSGAGKPACIFTSPLDGLKKARVTSAYEGLWCDCDTEWILDMWQLRHWDLENSGIAEGCTNYNLQPMVAVAETGVKRVLLKVSDGGGFIVGSSVAVGDMGSETNKDRNLGYMRNKVSLARISSKENVVVSGTTYTALNLELSTMIDTTTTCCVSTMPWTSGMTEQLPAHKDGAMFSLTGGKGPIRIAGVEMMHGAYDIGLDPLYNVTQNTDGKTFNYTVKTCRDSEKLSGSITADYKDTGVTYTGMASGWNWVKKFKQNSMGIIFPETLGGNSSGWYKSAFYGSWDAGVRCPWRFGYLYDGTPAGLACEDGSGGPSGANWAGRPRLSGAGKKRGELTA